MWLEAICQGLASREAKLSRKRIALMPKKIRELKSMLLKAGFTCRPGKGSHSKWIHAKLSKSIIIAGKDGSDVKTYLEKQVNEALEALKEMEAEDTEE